MWPVTDHNPESGLSDLQEALKSNVSVSLIGVGDNEIKYIAYGLIDHPSLKSIELIDVTNSAYFKHLMFLVFLELYTPVPLSTQFSYPVD